MYKIYVIDASLLELLQLTELGLSLSVAFFRRDHKTSDTLLSKYDVPYVDEVELDLVYLLFFFASVTFGLGFYILSLGFCKFFFIRF